MPNTTHILACSISHHNAFVQPPYHRKLWPTHHQLLPNCTIHAVEGDDVVFGQLLREHENWVDFDRESIHK